MRCQAHHRHAAASAAKTSIVYISAAFYRHNIYRTNGSGPGATRCRILSGKYATRTMKMAVFVEDAEDITKCVLSVENKKESAKSRDPSCLFGMVITVVSR